MNKTRKIIPGIFFIIGIFLLITAVTFYIDKKKFISNSLQVKGKVIKMIESRSSSTRSSRSHLVYAPVIAYIVNSKEYAFTSPIKSSPPAYEIGEEVTVYYDKNDPANAQLNSLKDYLITIVSGGLGFLFTVIPVIIFFAEKRKNKSK
ncbi:MAG: DUF3592 domain-containing protein [Chitinophagaceae bacterium]|nr:DUF3592 domain-containing protein [Chitinophagaceae bacterium]